MSQDSVDRLLPMNPVEFLVLAVLADGEMHGYGLVREIRERTAGRVKPRAGNLYRVLDRLLKRDLIQESDRRPPSDEGPEKQRRFYRITSLGRRAAVAEADLRATVAARSKSLHALKEAS